MLRKQLSEGHVVFKIQNVAEGLHFARMVIKHQQDAGEGEDDEQIKCDAAHAPREFVFYGVAIDLGGMQVEENVGQDRERAIARRLIVLDAENGTKNLGLLRFLQAFDFFLALFLDRIFKVCDVLADTVEQPGALFFAVFFGHSCSPK